LKQTVLLTVYYTFQEELAAGHANWGNKALKFVVRLNTIILEIRVTSLTSLATLSIGL
jgi:hypothetical protein